MAVTSDYMSSTVAQDHTKGAARLLARAARRFAGAVMIMAAFGLWLMPGATVGADALMIKLVVSLVIGVSGLSLMAYKQAPRG